MPGRAVAGCEGGAGKAKTDSGLVTAIEGTLRGGGGGGARVERPLLAGEEGRPVMLISFVASTGGTGRAVVSLLRLARCGGGGRTRLTGFWRVPDSA